LNEHYLQLNPQRPPYFVVKSIFLIAVAFLIINACVVPIDLNFPVSDGKLVVDGYITNVEKRHLVKLSYSSGFNDNGIFAPNPVANATVEIVDDSGQSILLAHENNGAYFTPLFKAEANLSYKIIVQVDEQVYESTFQRLPNHTEDTKIRYEVTEREVLSTTNLFIKNEKGFGIYVEVDSSDEPVYYHWVQKNYRIFEAFRGRQINQAVGAIELPNIVCYVRNIDRVQLDIFEKLPNNNSAKQNELELDFYLPSDFQFHDFAVEVDQLITNKESFEYWNDIKRTTESVGSIFDPAPFSITGNVSNLDGTATLGFFGVYNESTSRIFYNNCEVPLDFRRDQGECPIANEFEIPTSRCYDCTFATGIWSSTEAPNWWRPIPDIYSDDRKCEPFND